jgi:lipopolysaccharide export LptBFGC system permease protein LptF
VGTYDKEQISIAEDTEGVTQIPIHQNQKQRRTKSSSEKRIIKPEEFSTLEYPVLLTPFGFYRVIKTPYYGKKKSKVVQSPINHSSLNDSIQKIKTYYSKLLILEETKQKSSPFFLFWYGCCGIGIGLLFMIISIVAKSARYSRSSNTLLLVGVLSLIVACVCFILGYKQYKEISKNP